MFWEKRSSLSVALFICLPSLTPFILFLTFDLDRTYSLGYRDFKVISKYLSLPTEHDPLTIVNSRTIVESSGLKLLTMVQLKQFQKPGGLLHASLIESSEGK